MLRAVVAGATVVGAASGPAAGSGALQVDGDNPPSDDSDGDSSFATIQEAVDSAEPGATIEVAPGTYNEHVHIATDGLTLTGRPGDTASRGPAADAPILDGQGTNEHGIRIEGGVAGVTIEGFEIRDYGFATPTQPFPDGTGVRAGSRGDPAADLVVRHNYLHTLGTAGVRIEDGVGCIVTRNEVRNIAGPYDTTGQHPGFAFAFGITLANNSNGKVTNNLVIHGQPEGGTTGSSDTTGIRVKAIGDGGPRSEGVRVAGNTIRGPFTVSGITVNTSPGSGRRVVANTTIEANDVSGSANTGLDTFLKGDEPHIRGLWIRNNSFRSNDRGGIRFGSAEAGGQYDAIEIDGNTVEANAGVGIAFPKQVPLGGVRVVDNDLTATRPTTGFGVGLAIGAEEITDMIRIEGNDISDNRLGIAIPNPSVPTDRITVRRNNIHGNEEIGLVNAGGPVLDAEENWWGAPNGPEREAGQSGRTVGDGDRVSDHVDFKPWRPRKL